MLSADSVIHLSYTRLKDPREPEVNGLDHRADPNLRSVIPDVQDPPTSHEDLHVARRFRRIQIRVQKKGNHMSWLRSRNVQIMLGHRRTLDLDMIHVGFSNPIVLQPGVYAAVNLTSNVVFDEPE